MEIRPPHPAQPAVSGGRPLTPLGRCHLTGLLLAVALAAGRSQAAEICATVFVTPAVVSEGQTLFVVADIMSCGTTFLDNVSPCAPLGGPGCAVPDCIAIAASGGASLTPVSGPTPACVSSLAPGAHAFYTWQYTAGTSGTVDFTLTVTGEDNAPGGPVAQVSATGSLDIQEPARLSVTLFSSAGATVSFGQSFEILLHVQNVGGSVSDFTYALDLVITGTPPSGALPCPLPPLLGAAGALQLLPCPVLAPLCPPDPARKFATIDGGSSTIFTWLYLASAPGTVTVKGEAAGTDHNFPALSATSNIDSMVLTIPAPPVLNVTVAGPTRAVQGQEFDLQVGVTNINAKTVCQTGFTVKLNGSTQDVPFTVVLEDLADSLLPQCYDPCQLKVYTLRVRLSGTVLPQAAILTVEAAGSEQATGIPILSVGPDKTLEISRSISKLNCIEPNPFRPRLDGNVKICYVVAPDQAGRRTAVKVYSVTGELVKTLVDDVHTAGVYDAVWDGRNSRRQLVASGTYLVLFQAHATKQTRKLSVIK